MLTTIVLVPVYHSTHMLNLIPSALSAESIEKLHPQVKLSVPKPWVSALQLYSGSS